MSKVHDILNNIKQLFDAAENPLTFNEYDLADGTKISADKLEVGGTVKVGDAVAAPGEYALADGSSVTVGENGVITAVTPKPVEDMSTPEGMRKAYDKFATGSPEERLGNLEMVAKALMEYSFGWQLREQEQKATAEAAMKVYKDNLAATQATVVSQNEMLKQMFALVSEMAGAPVGDPPINTKKKSSFSNVEAKNKSLEKFQAAASKLKEEWDKKLKVA